MIEAINCCNSIHGSKNSFKANGSQNKILQKNSSPMVNDVKKLAIMADDLITYHNAMVTYSLLFPAVVVRPEPLFKKYTECLYAHAVAEFGLENQEQIKSMYKAWLDLSHKKGGLNKFTVNRYHLDGDEYLNGLRKKYIQKQNKLNEKSQTL